MNTPSKSTSLLAVGAICAIMAISEMTGASQMSSSSRWGGLASAIERNWGEGAVGWAWGALAFIFIASGYITKGKNK